MPPELTAEQKAKESAKLAAEDLALAEAEKKRKSNAQPSVAKLTISGQVKRELEESARINAMEQDRERNVRHTQESPSQESPFTEVSTSRYPQMVREYYADVLKQEDEFVPRATIPPRKQGMTADEAIEAQEARRLVIPSEANPKAMFEKRMAKIGSPRKPLESQIVQNVVKPFILDRALM
ncbi:MAG: hypothetical protein V4485_05610 [Pseudomonadota bacterium]